MSEPSVDCCDYRDHGTTFCPCPNHPLSRLHPYGHLGATTKPTLVSWWRCPVEAKGRGWRKCPTPETCNAAGCERWRSGATKEAASPPSNQ